MKIILTAAVLLALVAPVTAQSPTELAIEAYDGGGEYWFQLAGSSVRNPDLGLVPGESYNVNFTNMGSMGHNLHFGGSIEVKTSFLNPGQSEEITFNVPAGASGIEYWCDPHVGLGMVGQAVAVAESKDTPGFGFPVAILAFASIALVARRN